MTIVSIMNKRAKHAVTQHCTLMIVIDSYCDVEP